MQSLFRAAPAILKPSGDGKEMGEKMKKCSITLFFAAALMCVPGLSGSAWAQELVPGGMTVGLELSAGGVVVSRLTEVDTADGKVSPAEEAGLRAGDCIVAVDGREVSCGEDFSKAMAALDGGAVELEVLRAEQSMTLEIEPAKSKDGSWQLGLWLRDGASGIGTVTYYDPVSGEYGALGHGVNDADSGALLPSESGSVSPSVIVDIVPGRAGAPGELQGMFSSEDSVGRIDANTPFGIFGVMSSFPGGEPLETASDAEIKPGKATIYSNISGSDVEEFEIEIERVVKNAPDGKSMQIRVTDERLLKETGGIVQGMSGSPIIQDGKLVGAVTHVLVSDPTRGYGISIDTMLKAAA